LHLLLSTVPENQQNHCWHHVAATYLNQISLQVLFPRAPSRLEKGDTLPVPHRHLQLTVLGASALQHPPLNIFHKFPPHGLQS